MGSEAIPSAALPNPIVPEVCIEVKPTVERRLSAYSLSMEVAPSVWLTLAHFSFVARDAHPPPP